MSAFLQGLLKASKEIIPILATRKASLLKSHKKGAGGDISIGADLLCEDVFKKHLLQIASIDSEESGKIKSKNPKSSQTIILDPLDGSDNYLSNIPYYGASLALCDKNGVVQEAGIINFCTAEVFYDSTSLKAPKKLNIFSQKEIQINRTVPKCGIFEKAYSNPKIVKKLYKKNLKFRSLGASALSLAYALENNFMLFGGKIRKYDCRAGLFLCRRLEILHKKDFLLVSQNKEVFGIIAKIIG